MQHSLVHTLMMPMEVLQNQIQFLDGGHMEFGPTTMMWKIQNNVPFDAILEKWTVVHFIIGDLDIVIWDISMGVGINQLVAMMETPSIIYGKIMVRHRVLED